MINQKNPENRKNVYIENLIYLGCEETKTTICKENEFLPTSEKSCVICFDSKPTMFFNSCKHTVVCRKCCTDLMSETDIIQCPICKQNVDHNRKKRKLSI